MKQKNRPHELRFPYNKRDLLLGWRTLYFKEGEYVPDPKQSAQWNRGAYLVEGLGHCAMCHTAVNALGGIERVEGVRGRHDPEPELVRAVAHLQPRGRPRQLEIKEIVDLLQVGISHRATVYGPMAEVVYNSLQYMTDEDVEAMAVYLKTLPQARRRAAADEPGAAGAARRSWRPGARSTSSNARCATAAKARAIRRTIRRSPATNRSRWPSPVNPIRMVLNGGYPPGTQKNPRPHGMPPFAHILNDERGRGGGDLHPRRVGEQRHARDAGAGQRAAHRCCPNEEPMTTDEPKTRPQPKIAGSRRSCAAGPAGTFAVAGLATAIVVAIFFAFYFLVYLPRGAVQ